MRVWMWTVMAARASAAHGRQAAALLLTGVLAARDAAARMKREFLRRVEYEEITGLRADAIELMIKDAFKRTQR